MLTVHNSLTKRKEVFIPIEPGKIRMYVCGMTVYDYCHIGHARVMVVFDAIYRYLQAQGYDVTYVRNITDIDDKIIKRAQENNETMQTLTTRFIDAMYEDADALGVLRPNHEPKATEHLSGIVDMVQTLIAKGHAYPAQNGDVYYAVNSFAGYGKLSGKKLDELQAGARVEIEEQKRNPLDFVLWKSAKPGEPSWPSPWGAGRPGWHIECSAMSREILGGHFDIHGGGQDLQFPHHENEIAQSEACNGHKYVNYWLHNGFVRVNEEKMSKSLNNFFTIREVLKHYQGEEVRFFILNSHYRSALNYGEEQLDNARAALTRLYTALRDVVAEPANNFGVEYRQRFIEAMDDDFNTPLAIAVLFDVAREINKLREMNDARVGQAAGLLIELAKYLGIAQQMPDDYLRVGSVNAIHSLSDELINDLIAQRNAARVAKNWAEADRLRGQLVAAGIILEDDAQLTRWRRG
ncbi:MAG: cysteine--tRNA ligase [Gammaproteobacteria bacterium]|nr:cysteine--tRNA ligase [Gammaproteobacteria bacterium]